MFYKTESKPGRLEINSTGISYAKAIKIIKSAKNSAKHAYKLLSDEHGRTTPLYEEINTLKKRNSELHEQIRELDCKLVTANDALNKMREAVASLKELA